MAGNYGMNGVNADYASRATRAIEERNPDKIAGALQESFPGSRVMWNEPSGKMIVIYPGTGGKREVGLQEASWLLLQRANPTAAKALADSASKADNLKLQQERLDFSRQQADARQAGLSEKSAESAHQKRGAYILKSVADAEKNAAANFQDFTPEMRAQARKNAEEMYDSVFPANVAQSAGVRAVQPTQEAPASTATQAGAIKFSTAQMNDMARVAEIVDQKISQGADPEAVLSALENSGSGWTPSMTRMLIKTSPALQKSFGLTSLSPRQGYPYTQQPESTPRASGLAPRISEKEMSQISAGANMNWPGLRPTQTQTAQSGLPEGGPSADIPSMSSPAYNADLRRQDRETSVGSGALPRRQYSLAGMQYSEPTSWRSEAPRISNQAVRDTARAGLEATGRAVGGVANWANQSAKAAYEAPYQALSWLLTPDQDALDRMRGMGN